MIFSNINEIACIDWLAQDSPKLEKIMLEKCDGFTVGCRNICVLFLREQIWHEAQFWF